MSSAKTVTFEHDLFVIRAKADEPFAHGHLVPAVGLAPERVLLSFTLVGRRADLAEAEREQAEASRRQSQHLLALSYQEEDKQLVLDGRSLATHRRSM